MSSYIFCINARWQSVLSYVLPSMIDFCSMCHIRPGCVEHSQNIWRWYFVADNLAGKWETIPVVSKVVSAEKGYVSLLSALITADCKFSDCLHGLLANHGDVIKRKHFLRYWPFVRGIHRSPVNSPHKGQWRGALMFSFICVWINGWVNNCEAGDLRRYRAHYGVTVMWHVKRLSGSVTGKR